MPSTKVTFTFSQRGAGWTESYFLPTASSDWEPERVATNLLATKREALCGLETYLTYARLSEVGNPRRTRLIVYPASTTTHSSTEHSDSDDTALLARRKDSTNKRSSVNYLRGIWDSVVANGGLYVPNSDFTAAWNAYVGVLLSGGWGWQGKDYITSKKGNVSAVVDTGSGTLLVTLNADFWPGPFPMARQSVNISGVVGAASLNGPQIVIPTGLRTCTTVRRIPIFPYLNGGALTWNLGSFIGIASVVAERVVERKAGRPLYYSAGRRRARKLA